MHHQDTIRTVIYGRGHFASPPGVSKGWLVLWFQKHTDFCIKPRQSQPVWLPVPAATKVYTPISIGAV